MPAGGAVAVTSKSGDPQSGGWNAEAANDVDRQCPSDRNNYINCSTFRLGDGGQIQARKESVAAFDFLVLDDVGSKVSREKLGGVTPTWEIETSPGNSQVGFVFAEPIHDLSIVKQLQDAVTAAGLSDPGANGAARWVRLPYAINGKPKYATGGKSFECRIVEWHPAATYSVSQLVEMLGLTLSAAVASPAGATPGVKRAQHVAMDGSIANDVWTPPPLENPVITALKERGLYKRAIGNGRHDVTCPWVGEHTDGLDSGAAYFEPDSDWPVGGFKCQHSHGDRYHIGEVMKLLDVHSDAARGKPRIRIVPGEMNRITRAAEMALTHKGDYFQMGGAIVVVRTDPATGDVSTEVLSEPALGAALADAADWYRLDGSTGKPIRIDPPVRAVQALLKAGEYRTLPVLTGLARQPFFREEDGTLATEPGYDPVSKRYGVFNAARFHLPAPTEAAAREALATLEELLGEFKLASSADKAAAISGMMTAAVRVSLPVAPAFNITAAAPGSGKSYLASTIMPFAGPGVPLKLSYPSDGAEASKGMLAACLAQPAVIAFDDMQTQWLSHGALNRMLTSDTITDRLLGTNRTLTAGTRSLMIGTGNNIGPVRDMIRRVVTIRLHHKVQNPALVRYTGNPAKAVAANREKYVSAALTIASAWIAAGKPMTDVPPIASYGEWDELCRQPLLWLGLPDPAASIIEQLDDDPDQEALGALLKAWADAIGDKPITLRDMIDEAGEHSGLEDALEDLPVMDRDVINRSKLGWYLKRNSGRVVAGLELRPAKHSERRAWQVVAIDTDDPV